MKKLPPTQELFKLYTKADSAETLAESLHVSRSAIYDALKGYQPYIDHQRVKTERWKIVDDLIKCGLKRYEIAEKLGISVRTVQYLAKKAREKHGKEEK